MTFIEAASRAGHRGIRHESWADGLYVRWRTYGWERCVRSRGWEPLPHPQLAHGPNGILSMPVLIATGWSVAPEGAP